MDIVPVPPSSRGDEDGAVHEPLVVETFDSDTLLAERQARALNVTQHLYLLLKSQRWSEFCETLGSYTHLVEGSKDTVILRVPMAVPQGVTARSVAPSLPLLEDVPDHPPDEPLESQGVTVAVKLQAVEHSSVTDGELKREAFFLEKGTVAVRKGVCAHFPLMMAHIVYDTGEAGSVRWHGIVNEWADGDLGDLFGRHREDTDPHAIHPFHRQATIQAMMGLYVMNLLWSVYHNDLHPKNVLFVYLDTPTTFVYDLPSLDKTQVYRLTLRDSKLLCLIWDFSKAHKESELGSNDFYEFFSQTADYHPVLASEVRTVTSFNPAPRLDVLPWILSLLRHWADEDPFVTLDTLSPAEAGALPLPHPCVYSSMEESWTLPSVPSP